MIYTIRFIYSVSKNHKKYYAQTYLDNCKYKLKQRIIKRYINEDFTDFGSDSDCESNVGSESDFDSEEKQ